MELIVCMDLNNGIGKNNNLLVNNPIDMKYFKERTINKNIVMGRKTLESFKNQKPLPNRTNIVLSRQNLNRNDIIQFYSIQDFLKSEYSKDCIVIGGGEIYKQLLPYCNKLYITQLEEIYDADTFFPKIDLNEFRLSNQSDLLQYENIFFRFLIYERY